MSHEAILSGRIVGASGRVGASYYVLQDRNRATINRMPHDGDWPWLVRGMFALPGGRPAGTFRRQVIHFGASMKDDPCHRDVWDVWLAKFEALLRQLYWRSALVHLSTDFEPDRLFEWQPTEVATAGLSAESPQPIGEWVRSVTLAKRRDA